MYYLYMTLGLQISDPMTHVLYRATIPNMILIVTHEKNPDDVISR
jgi:hypothetical protein